MARSINYQRIFDGTLFAGPRAVLPVKAEGLTAVSLPSIVKRKFNSQRMLILSLFAPILRLEETYPCVSKCFRRGGLNSGVAISG